MANFRFTFKEGLCCLTAVFVHSLLGFVIAETPVGLPRRVVLGLLGASTALLLCGSSIIHLVVFSVTTSTVLHWTRKNAHGYAINLLLTFAYLVCFRVWHDCAQTHGILMQMLIRVVSLAVDLPKKNRTCDDSCVDRNCVHCSSPKSMLMILGYLWCYVGLLLTPAIRFRTYEHYVNGHFQVSRKQRKYLFLELMKLVVIIIPIAMILHFAISVEYSLSEDFIRRSIWFKLGYIAAMSFSFRCRLQVGLMLGEASAVALGLGLYPGNEECRPEAGPLKMTDTPDIEVNAMTIYSVRPSVELEVTFRSFMKKWNCTVQGWLVRCVYKQIPGSKALRWLGVFFFSGFWHGIYVGHWLFFVQVCLYTMNGEANFSTNNYNLIPYVLQLLVHNLAFGYWFLPYLILDVPKIWQMYSSLYFCGHLLLLAKGLSKMIPRNLLNSR